SDDAVREELAQAGRPKPVPDEIEALLHRYQAEKARRTPPEVHIDPAAPGLPPLTRGSAHRQNGSSGDMKRANGLPALTTNIHLEVDRLRAENSELKKMVAEFQQFFTDHDPQVAQQQRQELDQALAAKDAEIATIKQQAEEWNGK